jgi:O-antigen ligase
MVLLLQSHWDASLLWPDIADPGDLASSVANGDTLRRVFGFLLGMTGLVWLRTSGLPGRDWNPLSWVLAAWVGWLGFTAFISTDVVLSLKRFMLLMMALLAAAAFARMPSVKIYAWIGYGAIANLAAGIVAEVLWGTFRPLQHGYRFAGLTHPNMQGATLSVGVLAALGLVMDNARAHRKGALIGMICLCALFLTKSRTSIIALIVSCALGGLVLFIQWAARRGNLAHAVMFVLCIFAATTVVLIVSPDAHSMLGGAVKAERDDGNPEQLTGRVDLWNTCLSYASDHLVIGYGYDAFWSAKHIEDVSSELNWQINQAHSGYIDLLLSGGVPAVLLFVILLVGSASMSIYGSWNGDKRLSLWTMVIIFASVHCLTESITLLRSYPSFVLFVGLFQTNTGFIFARTQGDERW